MKVVLQRVSAASVTIQNQKVANIQKGLLVFVGISEEDAQEDINFLVRKILHLRIFKDENGVMNTALIALQGEILVVSQFTLQAETKKGNRSSYIKAAKPDIAFPLYEKFIQTLEKEFDKKVQTGVFGADMKVALVNDGPVTIVMDSKNKE